MPQSAGELCLVKSGHPHWSFCYVPQTCTKFDRKIQIPLFPISTLFVFPSSQLPRSHLTWIQVGGYLLVYGARTAIC